MSCTMSAITPASQPDVGRLMTGVGGVEGREQYCRADMEAIGVGWTDGTRGVLVHPSVTPAYIPIYAMVYHISPACLAFNKKWEIQSLLVPEASLWTSQTPPSILHSLFFIPFCSHMIYKTPSPHIPAYNLQPQLPLFHRCAKTPRTFQSCAAAQTGDWWLVTGDWLLVIGDWWLVIRLPVIGHCTVT